MIYARTILTLVLSICLASLANGQQRGSKRMYIGAGGGTNLSYFDVGGGTPGFSIQGNVLFELHPSWRLGAIMGLHRTKGKDAGTANAAREYEYRSNLNEFSLRVQYVVRFRQYPPKKWRRKLEPMVYAGLGLLQIQPIQNQKLSARENAGDFSIAPFFSGGLGMAYSIQDDFWIALEGGSNLSTSDYLEGYTNLLYSSSTDLFHTLILKVVYKVPLKRD